MACSHGDRQFCGKCDGPVVEVQPYPTKYGDITYLGPLGWEAPNPASGRRVTLADGTSGRQVARSLWSTFDNMPEEYQEKVRNWGAAKANGRPAATPEQKLAQAQRDRARKAKSRTV